MREKKSYRIGVILALTVAVIFVSFFAIRTIRIRKESEALAKNESVLQESIQAEKERAEQLESEKGRELTPKEMIEIARQRFGLVFPNEILFLPNEK